MALKETFEEEGVASELKGIYVAWLGQQEEAISRGGVGWRCGRRWGRGPMLRGEWEERKLKASAGSSEGRGGWRGPETRALACWGRGVSV